MTWMTVIVVVYLMVGLGMAMYETHQAQERNEKFSPLVFALVALFGGVLLFAALPAILAHAVPYLAGRFCGYVARRFAQGYRDGGA